MAAHVVGAEGPPTLYDVGPAFPLGGVQPEPALDPDRPGVAARRPGGGADRRQGLLATLVGAMERYPAIGEAADSLQAAGGEAFLGPDATAADVTPEKAVRAYRDALEHAGRSPATVAKHPSALRGLADALGAGDPTLRRVRSARVARGEPRALDHDEWQRLLRMPDRRSRQGKRDLALLHLLGSAGLCRAEASAVLVGDVDERRRSSDPRLRQAVKGSTSWWVTVRYGKRGRTRSIPLDEDTLGAVVADGAEQALPDPRSGDNRPVGTARGAAHAAAVVLRS